MNKQGRLLLILIILSGYLSSCISNIWTGANLVYDRHDVYKKFSDYQLFVNVNNSLYVDKLFHCDTCVLDVATFHGDILVAGHLPTDELLQEARQRLFKISGYRHLFIELVVSQNSPSGFQDSWITTKIRSKMFADDSIDPNAFKITTSDNVVFLMGDVKEEQALRVIKLARSSSGVVKVVRLLNYYTYQSPRELARFSIRPSSSRPSQESG
jgi:osmotically-inducible protein OsmY